MTVATEFPIPLNEYKVVALDPTNPKLTDEQREQLKANIQSVSYTHLTLPTIYSV